MSESKQPEKMTVSDALEIVRDSMGLWCAEYDEETGEQCQGVPVWTLKNLKHDTSSHRCEEHKPEKQHFADFVDPFRRAVAFDMIVTALATAERERDEARAELAKERADLAALTARVVAVRAQTIAECVALVTERVRWAYDGDVQFGARCEDFAIATALAALAIPQPMPAPQPAPTEPADVDPAAGALR